MANTRRALAIAELARDRGVLEAYRRSAMQAHWREGKDLERPADLREIADRAGLPRDLAEAAMDDPQYQTRIDLVRREASALGVRGIPTFVLGQNAVVGAQPFEVIARLLEMARAPRRS
jgi:predicted DsbA family dithiol-disulfide isomerase